jgi:hypothetical protein
MKDLDPVLAANLEIVRGRMEEAGRRVGRSPEAIRLVVVSKGRSAETVRQAYAAGIRDFGENRVEEALPKIEALADLSGLCWHMIGHLQSRKADRVLPVFGVVHSVDRWKIARLLDEQASAAGRPLPVMLECNVSGEMSKEGWDFSRRDTWEAGMASLLPLRSLPHLQVLGLMTMAPVVDDPNLARPIFRALRELSEMIRRDWAECGRDLSMGMSDDFEVAIEEGATMVRLGRAIFGTAV